MPIDPLPLPTMFRFLFPLAAAICLLASINADPLLNATPLLNGENIPIGNTQIPLCVPPVVNGILTNRLPKSAVTTKQTGTNCNQYGNPPARVVNDIESPGGLQDLIQACSGKIVHITDNLGEDRVACLYINPASTKEKPLPLVVWLQTSLIGEVIAFPLTGWDLVKTTQPLNNEDPSVVGFSYILPIGRNTEHRCEKHREIKRDP